MMLALGGTAFGWDGYDIDSGDAISIEPGNLAQRGNTLEIFDTSDDTYRKIVVQDIYRNGDQATIDAYDEVACEYRTFEMDDE